MANVFSKFFTNNGFYLSLIFTVIFSFNQSNFSYFLASSIIFYILLNLIFKNFPEYESSIREKIFFLSFSVSMWLIAKLIQEILKK